MTPEELEQMQEEMMSLKMELDSSRAHSRALEKELAQAHDTIAQSRNAHEQSEKEFIFMQGKIAAYEFVFTRGKYRG